MKKNLYTIIAAFIGANLLLFSCSNEVEPLFDQSSSERVEEQLQDYRSLLVKPTYGWAMEYYPGGSNQSFGGYALTVSFSSDGYSTFRSSLEDNLDSTAVSRYSVKKDVSITLNFDTYNKIFHYFSSPDISTGSGTGTGIGGDYEFILQSYTDSSVVMKGKKTGNIIRMYALKEEPANYLQKAKDNLASYTGIPAVYALSGTFGGEPVEASIITSKRFKFAQNGQEGYISFMFTDKGVKLYEPLTLNGYTLSELIWDANERKFYSPDSATILSVIADPLGLTEEQLMGEYTLTYTGSSGQQSVDAKIVKNEQGTYVLKGLPFDIKLEYSMNLGAMEIYPQYVNSSPQVVLAMWAPNQGGYLTWGVSGLALRTLWNGDENNFVLQLISNGTPWRAAGVTENVVPTGFILWDTSAGTTSRIFGEGRFRNLSLTKK